jgi:mono/diheme cytochrome c family protein
MVWKASAAGWVFASYVWNAEGTEATLAPDEGIPGAIEVAPGRRHSIPSRTDCTACHGTRRAGPLGFNPLQLSTDRDPHAIHGEPLAEGMLTLRNLADEGLLSPVRSQLLTNPPRIRTSNPSTRAVLGYLVVNCGTCHDGSDDVSVLGPSLKVGDLLADGDEAARSLLARPSKWQAPGVADSDSRLVHPGSPETSAMLVRMRSRAPSSQMPPLGTVLRDQQAVDAIGKWIALDAGRVP